MASNILANLKIKHAPKQKKAFSIKIQQPMPQTQPLQSFQSEILIPSEQLSTKQILQPAKSIVQIPVESKQPIKQSNITSKIFNKIGQFDIDRDSILNKIKMYKNFQGVSAINEEPIIEVKNQPLNVILEERETEKQTERREKEPTIKKSSRIIKIHKKLGRIILISSDEKNEKLIAPARKTHKPKPNIIEVPNELIIDDPEILKRLPEPKQQILLKASKYYMNNRQFFVNFITSLFNDYKSQLIKDKTTFSCENKDKSDTEFLLLSHQSIVRDYINLYTPYRGLLLYHGLGSGKTCSSIAIAEGIKSSRKVIIMTPASLRRNYIEEIKKCGDLIYRKNQYWEWISINDNPELVDPLSASLGLPREFIRRKQGAWLVNITKPTNYLELSSSDKKLLNDQLDEMITNKYTFINYNGLRRNKFKELTYNFEKNVFDDSIVIIDEAHNLISRIVNKINKISKFNEKKRGPNTILPKSIALLLYEFLLRADNCRVVLLTGTPIINYPNEIGILFNILRGYIKTWHFTLSTETSKKLSKDTIQEIFSKEKVLDYIDYVPSSKTLTVTRNPYGFENKITSSSGYKGVTNEKREKRNEEGVIQKDTKGDIIYEERGNISDIEFIKRTVKILKKNDITAQSKATSFTVNTALPDTLREFITMFINAETGYITNIDKFKRRIIGLTSYFRSAQEELLPSYDRNFDRHEVYIPMSDYQFKIYEDYRR